MGNRYRETIRSWNDYVPLDEFMNGIKATKLSDYESLRLECDYSNWDVDTKYLSLTGIKKAQPKKGKSK